MEPFVVDALSWKDDIPVSDYRRTIRTIDMAHASDIVGKFGYWKVRNARAVPGVWRRCRVPSLIEKLRGRHHLGGRVPALLSPFLDPELVFNP
jgi:hypothetical protein